MTANCLTSLYNNPLLSPEDLNVIFNAHQLVTFKKGEKILSKGEISNFYYCVEEGLIRSYVFDFKGNDITVDFFRKNKIAIDVISLFHRIPTVENFEALTECKCFQIDLETFQTLFHSIKGLTEWGRAWMSESLFLLKQRSISMITDSAKERYIRLAKQQPEILKYAPLKSIASYLGITATSLSRIRKELAHSDF